MTFRQPLGEPFQSPIDIYRHRPQRQTQTQTESRHKKRERLSERRLRKNVISMPAEKSQGLLKNRRDVEVTANRRQPCSGEAAP
jgi:hypothetical protein